MLRFKQHLYENYLATALSADVRDAIKQKGGKIYQIGVAVRDEILGKVSKDLDLLVVGLELDELGRILKPFGKVNLVGKAFGIIKFVPEGETEEIDISIPRVDSKSTGKGHKDFEVKLGKGITLQQDQLRRDFWINALAKDIDTGEVIDVERKGMTDIENKEIRMISPTAFEEDPLRMLRAVQFAARFDFKIEKETFNEIKKNARSISTVSAERFQEEFRKMFSKAKKPSIGIKLLFATGLMHNIFMYSNKGHIDFRTIDKLDKKAFPAFIAMLLSGYGNKAENVVSSVMRLSNNDSSAVQAVVTYMTKSPFLERDDFKLIRFLKNVDDKGIKNIDAYLTAKRKPTLSSKLKRMKVTSIRDLSVDGRDLMKLGMKGKQIGDALEYALEFAVRSGRNDKSELMNAIKEKFGIKEEPAFSEEEWGDILFAKELAIRRVTEQVEAESILKYYPSPREVKYIRSVRHKLIKKNPDMKPIGDDKLHVTLAGGPGWKKISSEFKGVRFDNPDFQLEFEEPKKVESSGKISWYMKVKQQRQLKDYVTDLLQKDPDPKRVFHVSIANKTGKVGDSVANI